jgi:hypothetical protein
MQRAGIWATTALSALAALAAGALSGCYLSHQGATPAVECREGEPPPDAEVPPVDLLFVVDDSFSMEEAQETLAREFPAMMRALLSGDHDGDGMAEFPPVRDLQVGITVTDMGIAIPGLCSDRRGTGNGLLNPLGNATLEGCGDIMPSRFMSYEAGEAIGPFAAELRCRAVVGTRGCAVEQPLEVALKALTPSTSELRFEDGTTGHGDETNLGFLREGSVLAIVVLTNEDDESIGDPSFYGTRPSIDSTAEENYRRTQAATYPITRYTEGFLDLVDGDRDRLVFAVIGGVPSDLVERGASASQILADPRTAVRFNEAGAHVPTCRTEEGVPSAYPPRRLLEVTEAFGPSGVVQSICKDTFEDAMAAIAARVSGSVRESFCD